MKLGAPPPTLLRPTSPVRKLGILTLRELFHDVGVKAAGVVDVLGKRVAVRQIDDGRAGCAADLQRLNVVVRCFPSPRLSQARLTLRYHLRTRSDDYYLSLFFVFLCLTGYNVRTAQNLRDNNGACRCEECVCGMYPLFHRAIMFCSR